MWIAQAIFAAHNVRSSHAATSTHQRLLSYDAATIGIGMKIVEARFVQYRRRAGAVARYADGRYPYINRSPAQLLIATAATNTKSQTIAIIARGRYQSSRRYSVEGVVGGALHICTSGAGIALAAGGNEPYVGTPPLAPFAFENDAMP